MAAGRRKIAKKASKAPTPAPVATPRSPAFAGASGARPRSPGHLGPAQRDIRPFIYLGLNTLFVVGYFYVLVAVIPNRMMSAAVHLWSLPVLMGVIALGTATVFVPAARRIGWWGSVIGCSLLLASTILLIIRVLISAAFLSGVYGAFGKAAALSALIGVALVVEIVALLPLFQLKYMRSRAGRRAYNP